ncbi:diacylglycerol/lipid kinase family protein [Gelidibacter gilvus]|uniref:Diacylglycerol kinase family lipid kinase n=1 Tax=Gelidibacter gilvus TaxID=59602 RepID=A0A4Q0XL63_9FLAO|nr:diacylglycerol kinase family protein [Gelidibacter gilvus]RXJ51332.1 diacylglycerol kinase family lipid kinase [Gelidibacter gilvus]
MIQIHFIFNPIAGSGHHSFSECYLQDYFEPENYNINIKSSGYKGHAIKLAEESIRQKADIIVACGGDGTINEVASTLVGTTIPLGIVPIGSGNGLASNLNIPKSIKKALFVIKNNQSTKIDVGCLNQRYFFSNIGFGFTASVIGNYEASQKRTLPHYVQACFKSFRDYNRKEEVVISIDDTIKLVNPFLIFISNSNVMGYSMSLTPKASLKDGLLDVIIVPRISRLKMAFFGFCMLLKRPELLKEVKCYQTDRLTLTQKNRSFFESQIDGELSKIKEFTITVSLKKDSLNVLV